MIASTSSAVYDKYESIIRMSRYGHLCTCLLFTLCASLYSFPVILCMCVLLYKTQLVQVSHSLHNYLIQFLGQPLYCFHFALVPWLHVTEIGAERERASERAIYIIIIIFIIHNSLF